MTNGSELKSPGARALRAAGFKPLPRWWVKDGEDFDLIEYIASKHADEVNAIRARALAETAEARERERQIAAAWEAMRAAREQE
jgi:hypothetical protein